jgi:hypothetical protein
MARGDGIWGNGGEKWGTAKLLKCTGLAKKIRKINVVKSASQASDEGSIPFTRSKALQKLRRRLSAYLSSVTDVLWLCPVFGGVA